MFTKKLGITNKGKFTLWLLGFRRLFHNLGLWTNPKITKTTEQLRNRTPICLHHSWRESIKIERKNERERERQKRIPPSSFHITTKEGMHGTEGRLRGGDRELEQGVIRQDVVVDGWRRCHALGRLSSIGHSFLDLETAMSGGGWGCWRQSCWRRRIRAPLMATVSTFTMEEGSGIQDKEGEKLGSGIGTQHHLK